MLKAEWPVEAGNKVLGSGKIGELMQSILGEIKPEAAYFIAANGKRTCIIFLDMTDVSQLPAIAEPFFLALNASVEVTPAMVVGDLQKAGPAIERAAAKYGR